MLPAWLGPRGLGRGDPGIRRAPCISQDRGSGRQQHVPFLGRPGRGCGGGEPWAGGDGGSHFGRGVLRGPHPHAVLQAAAEVLVHLHARIRGPTCTGTQGTLWPQGTKRPGGPFRVSFLPSRGGLGSELLVMGTDLSAQRKPQGSSADPCWRLAPWCWLSDARRPFPWLPWSVGSGERVAPEGSLPSPYKEP